MSIKAKQYCVAIGQDRLELEENVNMLLGEGWQPHGSVFVTTRGAYDTLHQPMTHTAPPAPPAEPPETEADLLKVD